MSLSRASASMLVAVSLVLPAVVAHGVIPKTSRIARAAVKTNQTSSRSQALQLDLTLRVAGREPIGSGKLVTHPTGLARLELRDAAGRTERHLLLGNEHSASRSGNELDRPRAFLPPLFFLQVDSSATLQQALSDFGLDTQAAALAPCGTTVCYVLGDPARVAPSASALRAEAEEALADETPEAMSGNESVWELAPEPEATPEPREEDSGSFSFFGTGSEPEASPTVWFDTKSFEIVRIESRDGVVVEFAPAVDFRGIRFPGAITISEPERDAVRFDVQGVTAVNAPAAGFTRSWLLAPDEGSSPADADSGVGRSTR